MRRKYRVKVSPESERDIEEIWEYIARDNIRNATQFIHRIEKKVYSLELLPERCPFIPENEFLEHQYRHLIFENYRIVFRIMVDVVWIARVVHSSRLLAALLQNIPSS